MDMKLYGEELDAEIALRREAREKRLNDKKSLRAKAKEMGMDTVEYCHWEHGSDICPHEESEYALGGVHMPYFIMRQCKKCGNPEIIAKIETEEDCDKYKVELEEALKNAGMLREDVE